MTLKEKVAMEEPDRIDSTSYGGVDGCPRLYPYLPENMDLCKKEGEAESGCEIEQCFRCWNQEISEEPAKKDEAPRVAYLCDQKACENCTYPKCRYTTDIEHAVNFKSHLNITEDCEYTKYMEKDKDEDTSGCRAQTIDFKVAYDELKVDRDQLLDDNDYLQDKVKHLETHIRYLNGEITFLRKCLITAVGGNKNDT